MTARGIRFQPVFLCCGANIPSQTRRCPALLYHLQEAFPHCDLMEQTTHTKAVLLSGEAAGWRMSPASSNPPVRLLRLQSQNVRSVNLHPTETHICLTGAADPNTGLSHGVAYQKEGQTCKRSPDENNNMDTSAFENVSFIKSSFFSPCSSLLKKCTSKIMSR